MDEHAEAVAAWESLYRAQVAVLRQIRRTFPDDMTMIEYDVLYNLSLAPGEKARIRDLNRALLITQSSVSRLADRLAERGLVAKSIDPDDARGTFVELTEAGARLFRRVEAAHADAIAERMLDALEPDELQALRDLTDKLRHSGAQQAAKRFGRSGGSTAA